MKNYINTALLALLLVLSTIYFINCRQLIARKAEEVLEQYKEINYGLSTLIAPDTDEPATQRDADKQTDNADNDNQNNESLETSAFQNNIPSGYYVTLVDNMIVVTLGDKETVFENTGISAENLEDSEIDKLKEGIFVDDITYVFNILESFSS